MRPCFSAKVAGTPSSSHCARSVPSGLDRKSTRLNSSHSQISYAVFCLKKKKHVSRIVVKQTTYKFSHETHFYTNLICTIQQDNTSLPYCHCLLRRISASRDQTDNDYK